MEFYEIDVNNLPKFIEMVTEALANGKKADPAEGQTPLADWERELLAQEPVPVENCADCCAPLTDREVIDSLKNEVGIRDEVINSLQKENDQLREANINYYHTIEVLSQRIEGMEVALNVAIHIANMD